MEKATQILRENSSTQKQLPSRCFIVSRYICFICASVQAVTPDEATGFTFSSLTISSLIFVYFKKQSLFFFS